MQQFNCHTPTTRVSAIHGMAVVISMLSATPANAKDEPRALTNLTACRAMADPGQRLVCYDREVAAFEAAAKSDKLVVLDQEQVRQTRRTLFGFPLPRIRLFGGGDDKRPSVDEEIDEIESAIVRIDRLGDGRVSFTIEGGAIWVQSDDRYVSLARVNTGSKVKINRGALGSYFATFQGNAAVKVKRQG